MLEKRCSDIRVTGENAQAENVSSHLYSALDFLMKGKRNVMV